MLKGTTFDLIKMWSNNMFWIFKYILKIYTINEECIKNQGKIN